MNGRCPSVSIRVLIPRHLYAETSILNTFLSDTSELSTCSRADAHTLAVHWAQNTIRYKELELFFVFLQGQAC